MQMQVKNASTSKFFHSQELKIYQQSTSVTLGK